MKERKKAIVFQLLAFFILLFLSAYRQASMQYIPDLRIRHYIVYAGYVFLIVVWVLSLRSRVTQRTIYRFLLGEAVLMWMGLTIRFVQDTFLQENADSFKNGYSSRLVTGISTVLGFVCCFETATAAYTTMGYNAASASKTWTIFGIMLVIYFGIVFGAKVMGKNADKKTRFK